VKFLRALFGKPSEEVAKPMTPADVGPDPVLAALAELEVKRLREALAASSPQEAAAAQAQAAPAAYDPDQPAARPSRVVKAKAPLPEGVAQPSVNIWDMDDARPAAAVRPAQEAPARRPTRTRTRILGFDAPPASVVPLFDDGEAEAGVTGPAAATLGHVMFPAGWLVVKDGPGKGAAFALMQGISQIGRGTDQTVALDFGDMAISRQNHASIAYDGATHRFHVGHGGKSNLVRLNGKPLLSTELLSDGDEIQIGETTLMLKVLCTPAFNWSAAEAGGDGHDMAIA
jgi:hypothetical protein